MQTSPRQGAPPPQGPTGHLGWAFSGNVQFEARAARFLAEGAERGERLLLVRDDPSPLRWPGWLLERGILQLASVGDVYGPDLLVRAERQRAAFAEALTAALDEGFSGIRVMADNTSLAATPDRLEAWLGWESVGDDFMAAFPVTGLCAFDATRLDPAVLDAVMGCHEQHFPG